ncbi:hypothetical protein ACFY8C_16570 [Streptomyces flavochromogenes]|uniref:GNAT family N-acetyltransferase n=1 Tax=Streptomyces flavochromogenes TaxID=68199 RepID=A0ABW6XR06_9ACTN
MTGASLNQTRRSGPLLVSSPSSRSVWVPSARRTTLTVPVVSCAWLMNVPVPPQRQVERVPRLMPGARAEIISGTGHGPQIDHAEEGNRRMLDFMASSPDRRRAILLPMSWSPAAEELRTARLSLLRPTEGDIEAIFEIHRGPRTCELYRRWNDQWQRYGYGYWVIRRATLTSIWGSAGSSPWN